MKRFLANLSYVLLVFPLLLIVFGFTYCSLQAENAPQSGALYSVTIRDIATGDTWEEEYWYDKDFTTVTCTYSYNGEVTDTKTWSITMDDPLISDTFEIRPHPTATAAKTEREEKNGYVAVRYYDAEGNLQGWSEMTYAACDRLDTQHDYAADGTVVRTTSLGYLIYDYDFGNSSEPTE